MFKFITNRTILSLLPVCNNNRRNRSFDIVFHSFKNYLKINCFSSTSRVALENRFADNYSRIITRRNSKKYSLDRVSNTFEFLIPTTTINYFSRIYGQKFPSLVSLFPQRLIFTSRFVLPSFRIDPIKKRRRRRTGEKETREKKYGGFMADSRLN